MKNITLIGFATAMLAMASCVSDGDETIVLEDGKVLVAGIPSDDDATEAPSIDRNTTNIPNINYTLETEGNDAIMKIDMTGIQEYGSSGWMHLNGTNSAGQNLWVDVDGTPKGVLVYNNGDDGTSAKIVADLVFLVDNSGSMNDEADAVARDIVSWSQKLQQSNLDIRFGCVGYSEGGTINGALNMTNASELDSYLNRNGSYGTSRTMGFAGADASVLTTAAGSMRTVMDECGGMALRYADKNMSFRTGANRIYVNFTDEPNQPNRVNDYSTESFRDLSGWNVMQGTVHTVYSADTIFAESIGTKEKPWRISWYTGGTFLRADKHFTGVTLENLPVTGAMQNSYVIRFTNIEEYLDGKPHYVTMTILSADGKTKAVKTFNIVFGTK